jgi:putative ABC transport system permease protein
VLRSLRYYRRAHLALALAVAVATAVLAGALVVGDSVRGSLRELALSRLGRVERVVAAERAFREGLAADWSREGGGTTAAALVARASARHGVSGSRASAVTVLGVDAAWEALFPGVALSFERREGQLFPSVLLADVLARELGAEVGDTVDLLLPVYSAIPRETLVGRQEARETVATLRLTVAGLLPERGLGGFRLDTRQAAPLNAVVERSRLARAIGARERANLLVARGEPEAGTGTTATSSRAKAEAALGRAVTLGDLGLKLSTRGGEVIVESERLVLDDAIVERLAASAREVGASSTTVFTYLANRMRVGDREVPYSTVAALAQPIPAANAAAAVGPGAALFTVDGAPMPPLRSGELALNSWAAEQLGAAPGARVELTYFAVGSRDALVERSATFRVASVVAMRGLGADTSLTPELPGLSDAARMDEWDPPFPVDLSRIRPVDEEYWQRHRAAPKAFVALADGQRLWRSRFGAVSSLRLTPPAGVSAGALARTLETAIPRAIGPAAGGLALREVRAEALAAGEGATDFAGLFLAFSFFLLAAALLLVALLEGLAVEARAREVGLLGALGFPARAVRRRLLAEAGAVSALGVLAGLAGAVGFAAVMLYGLRTWWVGAIGAPVLFLHVRPNTLLLGGGLSLLVVGITLAVAIARALRAPAARLLAGEVAGAIERGRRSALAWWTMLAALVGASVAVAAALLAGERAAPALAFGAGALVLVAGFAALADGWGRGRSWYRRRAFALRGPAWLAAGARNGARNRGRSLLAASLVACATFVLAVVAVNRGEADDDLGAQASGTGGFALVAESDVPIVADLNRADVREEMGLGFAGATVVPFRLLPGEDASCLNLYQPRRPRVLGAPAEMIARGGFSFQALAKESRAPWRLLDEDLGDGVVPAFADANSATWILKRGLGDDVVLADENGRPLRLRLVGLLKKSIFQSELLISERAFVRHFPSRAGASYFLVETPHVGDEKRVREIAEALETGLEPFGFDATSTAERLRAFATVEGAYLATFQALGGLGLLLGTVGLGVVLLRNALERRRELAMMSALGFRRGQLGALVLAENLVLLAAGLALGLLAAAAATAPHLAAQAARVPWQPLLWTLLAVLTAGCLASLAAVAATVRAPLVQALKEE